MIKDFLNYFKSDARFIHKPNFVPEYRDENGLMLYSMDSDLIYWDGEKQIVTSAVWHGQPFLTNLASLPKWLHWIIKPDNKYIRYPSAQHDGDYDKHSLIKRVKADWRYLGALKAEKCPFILRWVFFIFVRVFGSRYRA